MAWDFLLGDLGLARIIARLGIKWSLRRAGESSAPMPTLVGHNLGHIGDVATASLVSFSYKFCDNLYL